MINGGGKPKRMSKLDKILLYGFLYGASGKTVCVNIVKPRLAQESPLKLIYDFKGKVLLEQGET